MVARQQHNSWYSHPLVHLHHVAWQPLSSSERWHDLLMSLKAQCGLSHSQFFVGCFQDAHAVCTGLVQTVFHVKVYPSDWCVMFDDVSAGTPHRDTVCELCADGHYVDGTPAACVTHSACKADEQLVLPGSRWHDNVCATCDHLTQKGTVTHTFTITQQLHTQPPRSS